MIITLAGTGEGASKAWLLRQKGSVRAPTVGFRVSWEGVGSREMAHRLHDHCGGVNRSSPNRRPSKQYHPTDGTTIPAVDCVFTMNENKQGDQSDLCRVGDFPRPRRTGVYISTGNARYCTITQPTRNY